MHHCLQIKYYFFFVGFAFAGVFLNSRYSATMHAYAISADIAVIAPLIKPSENIANNISWLTESINLTHDMVCYRILIT